MATLPHKQPPSRFLPQRSQKQEKPCVSAATGHHGCLGGGTCHNRFVGRLHQQPVSFRTLHHAHQGLLDPPSASTTYKSGGGAGAFAPRTWTCSSNASTCLNRKPLEVGAEPGRGARALAVQRGRLLAACATGKAATPRISLQLVIVHRQLLGTEIPARGAWAVFTHRFGSCAPSWSPSARYSIRPLGPFRSGCSISRCRVLVLCPQGCVLHLSNRGARNAHRNGGLLEERPSLPCSLRKGWKMLVVRCGRSPHPLPSSLRVLPRCTATREDKTSKIPSAEEHRGGPARCKKPGQGQLPLRVVQERGGAWCRWREGPNPAPHPCTPLGAARER